jgi:putative tricarboxylic transport membrane protein
VAVRVFLVALTLIALANATAQAEPIYQQLRIIAPAAPGGGWDQTARVMQQVLQRAGIVRTAPVENIAGAAGTIGLARFIGNERGNSDAVMVSGLIMLGGIVTHGSPVTLGDVTPIARLTGEYEVIAVPAGSPLHSLADLIRVFRENPESVSWGGGSAGGSDQILAGLVAQAVGVAPRRVNYIAFSGGGESLSAILGGQVSVGVNGLAEFAPHVESGALRMLAISSAERLPGVSASTLREQGVDVVFENWRSVVGPPGIDAAGRTRLIAAIDAMVRSQEWHDQLARYRWIDRYLVGDPFARFVDEEESRVQTILRAFGSSGSENGTRASAGPYPLMVLTGLALCALVALVNGVKSANGRATRDRRAWSSDPAVADQRRGGSLDPPLAARWSPIALIALGAVIDLVLAERAGFVIASAVLFWLTARAFDNRHPGRDAVFAIAVSTSAYLLFARVLQLMLPAGVLAGWL